MMKAFFLISRVILLLAAALGLHSRASADNTQRPAPQQNQQTTMNNRMTPELLWQLGRLGAVAVSPDQSQIAYTVRNFRLEENSGLSDLHLIEVSSGSDTTVLQGWAAIDDLQWHPSETSPRIYFTGQKDKSAESSDQQSNEDQPDIGSGSPQAWHLNVEDRSTVQVTAIKDGISNLKLFPTGNRIAFTTRIKMKDEVEDIYPDLPKADARIIDSLMYRHWNAWDDFKFSHLYVGELDAEGCCENTFDLMEGIQADCPVGPFGGAEQFAIAADGSEIAFTMKNISNGTQWAQSTDSNVYVVPALTGAKPKCISNAMAGYDRNPVYSPDGKMIAFSSMERAGFESDRTRVIVYDRATEQKHEVTQGLDQNANHVLWAADSKSIFFNSQTRGTQQIYQLAVDLASAPTEKIKAITSGRFHWSIVDVIGDGSKVFAKRANMLRPEELFVVDSTDGTATAITKINDQAYQELQLPTIEERFIQATDGEKIHTWVIHPIGFDAAKPEKWPMLLYCQGGPQAQVGQSFSWRWNFHLMAARGYVIAAPNRRGLPGFGQQWNDQISGDWGGQAMQDLLSVSDSVAAETYVDEKKVAAVGASFGGYSIYWLMGHHQDRFSAMIAHCGVFNLESMYGSTEELFFVNWDMGGPYWANNELKNKYQRFSPHQFVKDWDTPLLVIHGQKDFRVPVTQGMEAFTVAQVQNVPSRFLYFPEEGHWVQSPQNSVLWHRVFFDWLDRFCRTNSNTNR
jgi:dipeptidyl aminopeptidase/acylaminoacyl peptidase